MVLFRGLVSFLDMSFFPLDDEYQRVAVERTIRETALVRGARGTQFNEHNTSGHVPQFISNQVLKSRHGGWSLPSTVQFLTICKFSAAHQYV